MGDSIVTAASRGWLRVLVVMLPLVVLGASCGTGELEALQAELTAAVVEFDAVEVERDEALAETAELQAALAELEGQLDDVPDVAPLEDRIAFLETELRDAESQIEAAEALDAREQELDQREAALDSRPSTSEVSEPPSPSPATGGGCSAGQVNINSAGAAELQRIHQVGPERAGQVVNLRPFSSVDGLTRVSGIGPSHLSAIKGQGLACVD